MHSFVARFLMFMLGLICSFIANADCAIKPNANIIFLKLDDLTGSNNSMGVSEQWEKVTDFLETNKIPASYGVIGDSLENDNPAYFSWLKKRVAVGNIELWNHGYISSFTKNKDMGELGEFDGRSAENQAQSLNKTQILGKKRIGIVFHGFGPHNSALDENTYSQLDTFPEINYVWFYKPLDDVPHKPYVFQRVANLETPIFHPSFEAFLKDYLKRPQNLGYIAIQGHPNMWSDKGYDQFLRIVSFLQAEVASFCTPLQSLSNSTIQN